MDNLFRPSIIMTLAFAVSTFQLETLEVIINNMFPFWIISYIHS
jgi:hypothetical protein